MLKSYVHNVQNMVYCQKPIEEIVYKWNCLYQIASSDSVKKCKKLVEAQEPWCSLEMLHSYTAEFKHMNDFIPHTK